MLMMAVTGGFSAPVVHGGEVSAALAPVLCVHAQQDAGRADVEAFVRRIYARRYGAVVQEFAPVLVSLRDAHSGEILAAAGYRPAQLGALFLERYLGLPVEQVLARHSSKAAPQRSGIVEIGHLAAERAGEGRRLIMLLAPWLVAQGFDWVVSTLTQELRHLFLRLGITPLALAAATPAALDGDAALWGSYYQHDPVVLAGELQLAMRQLDNRQKKAAGART